MLRPFTIAAGMVAWLLCAAPIALAYNRGVDCDKADTPAEQLICTTPELKKADSRLDDLFRDQLRMAADVIGLVHSQRDWLKARSQCADVACLKSIYLERDQQLHELPQILDVGITLVGTVGDQPLVLTLTVNPDDGYVDATPATSFPTLTGLQQGTHYHLCDDNPCGRCKYRRLELDADDQQHWHGSWYEADGKGQVNPLPVTLRPITQDERTSLRSDQSDIHDWGLYLDRLQVRQLACKAKAITLIQGHQVRQCSNGYVRIVDGYPAPDLLRINHSLRLGEQETLTHFSGVYASLGPNIDKEPDDFNTTVTPELLGKRIVSLALRQDRKLGGVPAGGSVPTDFYTIGYNIDVQTGQLAEYDQVIDPLPHSHAGKYKYLDVSLWVAKKLTKLYPKQMHPPHSSADACDYAFSEDKNPWTTDNWYLTPEGMVFIPMIYLCDETTWSIIPWSVIHRYPGSLAGQLP